MGLKKLGGLLFSFIGLLLILSGMPPPLLYAGNINPVAVIKNDLYAVAVIPEKTRIVTAGESGAIFLSDDAGTRWIQADSGTLAALFSISFPDGANGWISGRNGLVLNSSDAGMTWHKKETGLSTHLFSIDFHDPANGFAAGDWGKIIRTRDCGKTWQDVSLEEDIILYGIVMLDSQSACVVGEMGRIFLTENSGETWQEAASPVQSTLFCISRDNSSLCAAGLDGAVIYSTDRGTTWHQAKTFTKTAIYGISLFNGTALAAGQAGTALISGDCGMTWQALEGSGQKHAFWLGAACLSPWDTGGGTGTVCGTGGLTARVADRAILWGKDPSTPQNGATPVKSADSKKSSPPEMTTDKNGRASDE